MMDMFPRNLPVFQSPELPEEIKTSKEGILVWPEGQTVPMQESTGSKLPAFNPYSATYHFIDLLNRGIKPVKWEVTSPQNWITVSQTSNLLKTEYKLGVTIDWNKLPPGILQGTLSISADDSIYNIKILVAPPIKGKIHGDPIVEQDGHIFIQANEYIKKKDYSKSRRWTAIEELGYSDSACGILPSPETDTEKLRRAYLEYRFYTYSKGPAKITVFTLPTEPVNNKHGMRIAVSVDNSPKQIFSYKTKETSEQWKQNVLSNHARCHFNYNFSTPGWHTIKIYPWDPGVVLDQIMVNFNA
ncbi:MAG: BACON domain-containing protein, partial [Candidatus Saccharimonadales bacterium]